MRPHNLTKHRTPYSDALLPSCFPKKIHEPSANMISVGGNEFLNCHSRNCLLQLKLHHLVKPSPAICSAPKLLQRLRGATSITKNRIYDRISMPWNPLSFFQLTEHGFQGITLLGSPGHCHEVPGLQRQPVYRQLIVHKKSSEPTS